MNLVLLFDDDFLDSSRRVRLTGRRHAHIASVHRAAVGESLVVGIANGKIGHAVVTRLDDAAVELDVTLEGDAPPPSPITLVLALPRPKVLNRAIAGATSLGIKRIVLLNAWRVEKSYWKSPRLTPENLRLQSILGLEQARDTILPQIDVRRLFRPFVEDELPTLGRALVAHPHASRECPRALREPVTLVIGPEGGFIEPELASLERAGCELVTVGDRILRVETAIAAIVGRLV